MMPQSLSHLPPGTPFWIVAAVVLALALHIGGGLAGIGSGYAAVAVRKGATLHRRLGLIFVLSMMLMAVMGTALAILNGQKDNVAGGLLAFYLVATAWLAVRPGVMRIGPGDYAAFLVIAALSAFLLRWGAQAGRSGHADDAPFYYVFGSFAAFLAILDLKVIRQGGLGGMDRLARHLWRMCFALFFAAGSFFLGQQKVMPAFMHGSPVLWVLSLAPLALMVYWLVRIRRPYASLRGKTA